MSSEAFVLSAVCSADPAAAIRQALEQSGVNPSRVQDAVFGADGLVSAPDLPQALRAAGLACPVASVSSSFRAIFFAAQSILSGDVQLVVVVGLESNGSAALMLAAPEAVGLWNLLPRARLARRSLAGTEGALRAAGIALGEVAIVKEGAAGARLLSDVLDELEARHEQWGLVSAGGLAVLLERT
jgi:acetyl-CoA acetyltransferase